MKTFIKNRCWSNEKEFRLINREKANCRIAIPGRISAIIFGVFTPTHDEKIVKQIFQNRADISLFRMRMNHATKSLQRSAVDDWGA